MGILPRRRCRSIKVYGDLRRLAPRERKALERLYRRRIPSSALITPEVARSLAQISWDLNRQVALLVDRRGHVHHVILGDHSSILIPDLSHYRVGPDRLRGLRCIHTHLNDEPLSREDLTDMALLRLDAMVGLTVRGGLPGRVFMAHLSPENGGDAPWELVEWEHPTRVDLVFSHFIRELEDALTRSFKGRELKEGGERAILISATNQNAWEAQRSMMELEALAVSAGVQVLDRVIQRVRRYHPSFLMGKGKLREIMIQGLHLGATMLIFDQDLTPVQVNNIAGMVDLKVIDRAQIILDIFARRAMSREGKIQVELAQLRYLLPRLVGRGTAMSRLMGGVGGRGPGETKLEVDRRRVKERIASLERQLRALEKGRRERRKARRKRGVPVVSIIGYTNAGKSTLLNALTGARVLAENRLFATLDPTNRTVVLPGGTPCILSDTVGFIRRMPADLKVAFRATLEELQDATLLLHVVDATSPYVEEEIEAVEEILHELELEHKPRMVVYNKVDLLDGDPPNGLAVSAKRGENLDLLLQEVEERIKGSFEESQIQMKLG